MKSHILTFVCEVLLVECFYFISFGLYIDWTKVTASDVLLKPALLFFKNVAWIRKSTLGAKCEKAKLNNDTENCDLSQKGSMSKQTHKSKCIVHTQDKILDLVTDK